MSKFTPEQNKALVLGQPRDERRVDRLFHRVRGSLNVLGVEMIEDFKVLFKTLAYVRCHDRTVQHTLRSDRPVWILGIARAFGTSGDETVCLFHDWPHSQPLLSGLRPC